MKKKLIVLSLLAALAATVTSGTVAYYTSVGRAHNVITSGNVDIKLIEKMEQDDGTIVDFPDSEIKGAMPGISASKIVSVKNTGSEDAWVRIYLERKITNQSGDSLPVELTVRNSDSDALETIDVMELDINSAAWLEGEDDYYYYREPLKAGDTTTTLFENVSFAGAMGNEYQGSKADIVVRAEAVQSKNNPIPENGKVTDVKGWPKSRGGV